MVGVFPEKKTVTAKKPNNPERNKQEPKKKEPTGATLQKASRCLKRKVKN